METEKKPLNQETKAKFKWDTRYMWLTCVQCSCKFELTARAAAATLHDSQRLPKKYPILCFDCFDAT